MPRSSSLLLKIAIFLAGAAVIFVAQLDRAARFRTDLAVRVPAMLGGFADARIADREIGDDPARATELAREMLRWRPVAGENLGLFARAAVEAGDTETGSQALTLAAQRGWRDDYTQITVFASALTQENWEVAGQRVEALARGNRDQSVMTLAVEQMLASEAGRRALAERVADSPGFDRHVYVAVLKRPENAPYVADLLRKSLEQEAEIGCVALGEFAIWLLRNGEGDAVQSLWPSECATERPNTMRFTLGESDDPYVWKYFDESGVTIRSGSDEGTLDFVNRDMVERNIASKYLTLAPGSYTLAINSAPARGGSLLDRKAAVSVRMACGNWRDGERIEIEEVGEDAYRFEVGTDCSTQYLFFRSRRGRRDDFSMTIS